MSAPVPIDDEAVAWVVRLSSDRPADDDWTQFRAWLDSHPRARTAYDAALDVWLAAGATAPAPPSPSSPSRWALAAAWAACALLGLAAMAWWTSSHRSTAVLQTAQNERRAFPLEDGSRVVLAGDSRVEIALGGRARRATIARGDAVFQVAPRLARPFEVIAGDDALRVVGTEFAVHRRAGRLRVIVRRGAVAIGPAQGEAGPRVTLTPGSELNHVEGTQSFQVGAVDAEHALAW